MNQDHELPKLITFDGEARSGKGTIVQKTKDYLRDECGYKVMLIDAGQVFRVLVVAADLEGIDVDDPDQIDGFLGDPQQVEKCVQLVKDVYHMTKDERNSILYTNTVGANSAKIGSRPLSQYFKDDLLRKWLRDARHEGYEVVLLDGRALEETGTMLRSEGLCEYLLGLYFVCDPVVGARRTLGFSARPYHELDVDERAAVDQLVVQIVERNRKDAERKVQPIVPPAGAPKYMADEVPPEVDADMIIIDTSPEMSKSAMSLPVAKLVAARLQP